jgi:pantothenate kinase
LTAKKPDLLIFDRLYLTQAFRTKCEISDYSEIEELLSKYAPLTVFLEVDEDRIEDRFSRAAEHRGSDYFKSRWTSKERAQYYIAQQRSQLKLLEQSTIPHQVFDTTRHNYEEVVQRIIRLIEEW